MSASERLRNWELSRRETVFASVVASVVLNVGLMSTDFAPRVEWIDEGDTTEQIDPLPVVSFYVPEGETPEGFSDDLPTPRCQIIQETDITISKEPDQERYASIPIPAPVPIFRRRNKTDDSDAETETTDEPVIIDVIDVAPGDSSADVGDKPVKEEQTNTVHEQPEEQIAQSTQASSQASSSSGGYGVRGRSRRRSWRERRHDRLMSIYNENIRSLDQYKDDVISGRLTLNERVMRLEEISRAYTSNMRHHRIHEVILPRVGKAALLVALLGVAGAAAAVGYKKADFEGSNCFVEVDKDEGAFDPGLNWRWDCEIDLSTPPPRSNSGRAPIPSRVDPCEGVPVHLRTIRNYRDTTQGTVVVDVENTVLR